MEQNSNPLSPDLLFEHRPACRELRNQFTKLQEKAIWGKNDERRGVLYMGADVTEFLSPDEIETLAKACAEIRIKDASS